MKLSTLVMTGLAVVGTVSLAMANPALLPKHPGYPAGGNANDAGQINLTHEQSLKASAASEDAHTGQMLVDANDARKQKLQEAGQKPAVEGSDSKSNPPVSETAPLPQK
jgi:hypothetical protein